MIHLDFSAILTGSYLDMFIQGARTSMLLFAATLVLAVVVALVLIALRSSQIRVVEAAIAGYVAYHRNTPLLVQLFVWYFGVPQILPSALQDWINQHNSEFIFALIALALNSAAYISEDIRSGLRSVDPGQNEAARALGLTYLQGLKDIMLPQAIRIAAPALTNQTLTLFKSTSLAMAIGVAEMTYISHQIDNTTFRSFEACAVASVFYLTVSFVIMGVGAWISRPRVAAA